MRYLGITSPDINNGTGCRVTLWISGCNHKCPGCHNPETWDYNKGEYLLYTPRLKSDNALHKVYKELDKSYIQGLTISGGDPLAQNDVSLLELLEFIQCVKHYYPSKDIWIYSGDVYEELIKHPVKRNILDLCDVLVDGPYKQDLRDITLPFRGSSNQRILYLKKL